MIPETLDLVKTADQFEEFCANLCAELDLGFPVHLAEGPDQGKDIVLRTRLQEKNSKTFLIHVECKYTRGSKSLGADALLKHAEWAYAEDADILLVMTNRRISSGVHSWIKSTQHRRSFPIIVWDGNYLRNLTKRVFRQDNKARDRAAQLIQKLLLDNWHNHQSTLTATNFDVRIREDYAPPVFIDTSNFVNRDEEVRELTSFNNYGTAAIIGAPGIGKTFLATLVLQRAISDGFSPVHIEVNESDLSNLTTAVINIARTLAHTQGAHALLDHIAEFGIYPTAGLFARVAKEISRYKLFIFVEDLHKLAADDRLFELFKAISLSPGVSRLLFTSRSNLTNGRFLNAQIIVEVEGFKKDDTRKYLQSRKVKTTDDLLDVLTRIYQGWPLLISLVASQISSQRKVPDLHTIIRSGAGIIKEAIVREILQKVPKDAMKLLEILVNLKTSLSLADLEVLTSKSPTSLRTSWQSLFESGLLRSLDATPGCIHDLIRGLLIEILGNREKVALELAEYLASFNNDPHRILIAVQYYCRAGRFTDAAALLIKYKERLLRAGKFLEILQASVHIPEAEISETNALGLSLVESRSLENLGRYEEAFETLECHYQESFGHHISIELKVAVNIQQARNLYFLADYRRARKLLVTTIDLIKLTDSDGPAASTPGRLDLFMSTALYLLSRISYIDRNLDSAEDYLRQALSVRGKETDPILLNKIDHRLAMIYLKRGNHQKSLTMFRMVMAKSKRLGDRKREAYSQHRIAVILKQGGDLEKARELVEESIKIKEEIGLKRGIVYGLLELASIDLKESRLREAEEKVLRGYQLAEELSLRKEILVAQEALVNIRMKQKRFQDAKMLANRIESGYRDIGLIGRSSTFKKKFDKLSEHFEVN